MPAKRPHKQISYRKHRRRFYGTKAEIEVQANEWRASIDKRLGPRGTQLRPGQTLLTVGECVAAFLAHHKQASKEGTFQTHFYALRSFVEFRGEGYLLRDLIQRDATQWIEDHHLFAKDGRPLTHNTVRSYRASLKACFNWCLSEGLIKEHPFPRLTVGAYRPSEKYIDDQLFQEMLDNWAHDPNFCDYLLFMRLTGARVQEARTITSANVDFDSARIICENKTRRLTGKPRVILLNDDALEIVRRHAQRNPRGPIFRNSRGTPWECQAVRSRFVRAHKAGKISARPMQKSLRHSFATYLLAEGGGVAEAADLMGHADTSTILRYYQHVGKVGDHMRQQAERQNASRFHTNRRRSEGDD